MMPTPSAAEDPATPVFVGDPAGLATARVGDTLILDGPEALHASRARRLRPASSIVVVDGRGRRVRGQIAAVDRAALSYLVMDIDDEPPPEPRITVIQALPKGDRGERAVETLTEVGVDVVVPWAAERCITVWSPDRRERGLGRWRTAAHEAAKQSRRSWIPVVTDPVDLAGVTDLVREADAAILLDEARGTLDPLLAPPTSGRIIVIVGPEGGVAPMEGEAILAAGAVSARMGPTVLRTSTAGTVAAAVLLAHTPRWQAGSGS